MSRRSPAWAFGAWVALSLAAAALARAAAALAGAAAPLPEPAMAFLSVGLLHGPLWLSLSLALILGSDAAQAALAPPGLVEASFVWSVGLVALARDRWFGRAPRDVALAAGLLSVAVRILVVVLSLAAGRRLGFASTAVALVLPAAAADAALALVLALPLSGIWRRMLPALPPGLAFGRR